MNLYAVAYMNCFNGELKLDVVEADGPIAAIGKALENLTDHKASAKEWYARLCGRLVKLEVVDFLGAIKDEFMVSDQRVTVMKVKFSLDLCEP